LGASQTTLHLGIRFDRVEKRFGSLIALRGVSLEIHPGEFVAMLGPNGAGKTTLLRIAALLMNPTNGAVQFSGSKQDRSSAKSLIGMVGHSTLLYD
jgi:ABC-type multidrug transport system ATPase subunit